MFNASDPGVQMKDSREGKDQFRLYTVEILVIVASVCCCLTTLSPCVLSCLPAGQRWFSDSISTRRQASGDQKPQSNSEISVFFTWFVFSWLSLPVCGAGFDSRCAFVWRFKSSNNVLNCIKTGGFGSSFFSLCFYQYNVYLYIFLFCVLRHFLYWNLSNLHVGRVTVALWV